MNINLFFNGSHIKPLSIPIIWMNINFWHLNVSTVSAFVFLCLKTKRSRVRFSVPPNFFFTCKNRKFLSLFSYYISCSASTTNHIQKWFYISCHSISANSFCSASQMYSRIMWRVFWLTGEWDLVMQSPQILCIKIEIRGKPIKN